MATALRIHSAEHICAIQLAEYVHPVPIFYEELFAPGHKHNKIKAGKTMQKSYAYGRIVAGNKENLERVNAMCKMWVSEENIFFDYPTKKNRNCPQYQRMLKMIKEGDLLYIDNLSALGDGYKEVREQWRILTKEKKAEIIVMDMPAIDTRSGKEEHGAATADIVLAMLEYVSESESNIRKNRQREGIAEARERGIIFGRPEYPAPNFAKAYNQWLNKEISADEAADMCGLNKTTFYKRAKKAREKQVL